MSKPRKYTKGIIIEPLMDTNGHEYFFYEAVSLIIYISCVSCFSWFLNRYLVVRTVLSFSCAFVCIRGSKIAFYVFHGLTGWRYCWETDIF